MRQNKSRGHEIYSFPWILFDASNWNLNGFKKYYKYYDVMLYKVYPNIVHLVRRPTYKLTVSMNLHIIFVLWLSHVFYPRLNLKFASGSLVNQMPCYKLHMQYWLLFRGRDFCFLGTHFISWWRIFISWDWILFRGNK